MSNSLASSVCPLCGNATGNRLVLAREMMFGTRDAFHYLDCSACHGVYLLDVPADLSKYYPSNYYSFAAAGGLKWALKKRWAASSHGQWNPLGWLIKLLVGEHVAISAIHRAKIALDARVLDVGCGSGLLLRYMKHIGYTHAEGVDPFIDGDIHDEQGLLVQKRTLAEMDGRYDVLMLHHSFEHLLDPEDALKNLVRLLAPGGRILMRLPVGGCLAWQRYGADWVNLDAPRHLYLFSPASLQTLAARCGLAITRQSFEASPKSFVSSDLYARDVPLVDHGDKQRGGLGTLGLWFAARKYRALAEQNNRDGQADCACFELQVQ